MFEGICHDFSLDKRYIHMDTDDGPSIQIEHIFGIVEHIIHLILDMNIIARLIERTLET